MTEKVFPNDAGRESKLEAELEELKSLNVKKS